VSFVVLYDANVLYPSTLRDLLIRIAQAGLVQAKWTDQILDEVFRNLTVNRPDLDPQKLARTGNQINPVAVEAMNEVGIDITGEQPKKLTDDAVAASDVVITMGCGDECPYFPGKRYEDWVLVDPAGQGIDIVREVRDDIRARIEALIDSLLPAGQ